MMIMEAASGKKFDEVMALMSKLSEKVKKCKALLTYASTLPIDKGNECSRILRTAVDGVSHVYNVLNDSAVGEFERELDELRLQEDILGQNVNEHAEGEADFFDDIDESDMMKACEEAERSMEDPYGPVKEEDEELCMPADAEDRDLLEPDFPPPLSKHLDVLNNYFGHSCFRAIQWKIIYSLLEQRCDQCVVMATGYGKSLCYQFPAVYTGKMTVVISPLISLMEDQVMALQVSNINACLLGSAQENNSATKNDLLRGNYSVLYVTPEFAETADDFLKRLHEAVGLTLVAIDEAHCVSQWGHDFRAAYRKLGSLRSKLSDVPFMALTATATPAVKKDIIANLKLKNTKISCTGFDRPNLFLEASVKSGSMEQDLCQLMTAKDDVYSFDGPTIVYCPTKKTATEVFQLLKSLGVTCGLYHAGLGPKQRKEAHHSFIKDKIQVIVATVAFGMGIDKPDVRRIIHYGAPKDIESYYQEIGRAGRDGAPSICHAIYNQADFVVCRYFLSQIQSEKFREHKIDMMHKMEQYLTQTSCRRRALLEHFEGKSTKVLTNQKSCCDNCTRRLSKPAETSDDYAKEAEHLLRSITATGSRFGMNVPVLFLRGSTSQRIPKQFKKLDLYGQGRYHSEQWWKAFGRVLIFGGYLKEASIGGGKGSISYTTVSVSSTGERWLRNYSKKKTPLHIQPSQEMKALENRQVVPSFTVPMVDTASPKSLITRPPASSPTAVAAVETKEELSQPEVKNEAEAFLEVQLYQALLNLRSNFADELDIPPFVIANNKTLVEIARTRPSCPDKLMQVEGMSQVKVQRFGDRIIKVVTSFCQKEGLQMDQFSEKGKKGCSGATDHYSPKLVDAEASTSKMDQDIIKSEPLVPNRDFTLMVNDEKLDVKHEDQTKADQTKASSSPFVKPLLKYQNVVKDSENADLQISKLARCSVAVNKEELKCSSAAKLELIEVSSDVVTKPDSQEGPTVKRKLPSSLTFGKWQASSSKKTKGNSLFKL